jgi:hypothetical protein
MTKLPARRALLASTSGVIARLPSARLPTNVDDNHAIEVIDGWLSTMGHRLNKEYGREWLQTELEKELREGDYEFTLSAINEANAGNEIAHEALLTIARELLAEALPERKSGHLPVRDYGMRAWGQPYKRLRGRSLYDNFVKNMLTCYCVILACYHFGVPPTRNRAHTKGGGAPSSGISLVVAALEHRGIYRDEKTVQEKIWYGLPGALARRHAPAQLWPR